MRDGLHKQTTASSREHYVNAIGAARFSSNKTGKSFNTKLINFKKNLKNQTSSLKDLFFF